MLSSLLTEKNNNKRKNRQTDKNKQTNKQTENIKKNKRLPYCYSGDPKGKKVFYMQIKHVWRGQVRPLLFQFLNIAIAGQNSVAPPQNVIKNEIQLVIFFRESIPTVTKLIPGLQTVTGIFFREILVGGKRTFYNLARVDKRTIYQGQIFST